MPFLNLKTTAYTSFVALTLIYLCFGTANANIDSWYYAACVKYRHELINSHHLLYNGFGYFIHSGLKILFPGIEAMRSLQIMNAIAAGGCLFVLYGTLKRLGSDGSTALSYTLLCGVSFGFMRFATDAETYILPVLCSLLSVSLLTRKKTTSYLILSGCFAALSVLFHQLHIWWTLAIFFSIAISRSLSVRQLISFSLPHLLIPVVYLLAWQSQNQTQTLLAFVSGEYTKGNAGIDLSLKSLALTGINGFRTLFQIHGQIPYLFRAYPLICAASALLSILLLLQWKRPQQADIVKQAPDVPLRTGFMIALLAQLVFACLSSGNAEFMVMLPFLLVLYLSGRYTFSGPGAMLLPVLGMFVWNMFSGILPSASLNLTNVNHQAKFSTTHPESVFVWNNRALLDNILCYRLGFKHGVSLQKYEGKAMLVKLLENPQGVYTDIGNPATRFSRGRFLESPVSEIDRNAFSLRAVDSFENLYGKNYIYRIQALK